ncbi:MAG: stage III sporulation protein AA [Clostridia bacterium]|nr:stage III sporulation protein AA [Clostridia bacterium]MDD4386961.1 stage III sporulation protein AA [Clostridia bacterium]
MENVLNVLPSSIKSEIQSIGSSGTLNEIRLRVGRKCIIYISNKEIVLEYIVVLKDLLDILVKASSNSIYAIQNDINQGFVTIKGGHRIGICGEVVIDNGKIKNIKNINSMNIRIARQIIGCSDKILPHIVDSQNFENTLIISSPGCGKTTMLRDIIRQLSQGIPNLHVAGVNVGVIDERGEIASIHNGIPGLDVGMRTDVLTNVPKNIGIEMLVRSMGIKIVATDEIGTDSDMEAIKYAALSGVGLIFTMHGKSIEDVYRKECIKSAIKEGLFDNIIILSNENGPGTIKKIHKIKKIEKEVV